MHVLASAALSLSCISYAHASLRGGIPDEEFPTFHQSGFGGKYNIGHFPDTRSSRRHLIQVPQSANPHAIPSVTAQNIENVYGHWYHDEHHSPFASHLYDRSKEELDEEQAKFLKRMDQVRKEWGMWEFRDHQDSPRPVVNFDKTPYRDMLNREMAFNTWQKDEKYTMGFIAEGKKLVDRVIEGIYAEYGHPTKGLSEEEITERDELFGIQFLNSTTDERPNLGDRGIAYMTDKAFDMLARKLLHSMITNDEFYVVLGGHSAAAGHGNNFHQTKAMSFHLLMEPVLQKLGVRLISRNLAMGGLGTIHFSFGQGSLYGERDLIFWDSGMTEKDAGSRDFFNKQAVLNGERVPILMASDIYNLDKESDGNLWYGDIKRGYDLMPITEDAEQALKVPYAARYMKCGPIGNELNLCGDKRNPNTYNGMCWVDRSDYTPPKGQGGATPGRAGWHPGFRQHQFEGRKYSLTVLYALRRALEKWETGIEEDKFPLREHHWHMGEIYEQARQPLIDHLKQEDREKSFCEEHLGNWKLPTRICSTPMKGMTEFTPRNLGDINSIRYNIKAAPNGYKPAWYEHDEYEGFDLMPLTYKIPEDDIDVHAIAIATNYKAPVFEGGNGADDEEADVGRRALRKTTHENEEKEPMGSLVGVERKLKEIGNKNPSTAFQANRVLYDNEVIPGQGWTKMGFAIPSIGYCDGSTMSTCKRHKDSDCLLYGHNDSHGGIAGDGLSGWLVIQIPKLKLGIITAKFEWWSTRDLHRTKDWTEVNDGKTTDTTPYEHDTAEEARVWDGSVDERRRLKAAIPEYPEDSKFDFALNGKIFKTMDLDEFKFFRAEMNYNNAHFAIMDDQEMATRDWDGEPAELGIRLRSETDPRALVLTVNHIYYA